MKQKEDMCRLFSGPMKITRVKWKWTPSSSWRKDALNFVVLPLFSLSCCFPSPPHLILSALWIAEEELALSSPLLHIPPSLALVARYIASLPCECMTVSSSLTTAVKWVFDQRDLYRQKKLKSAFIAWEISWFLVGSTMSLGLYVT